MNKKVLFADLYYPPSHRNMEEVTLNNLSQVCDLYIMAPGNWYSKLPVDAHIIETPNYHYDSIKSTKNRLRNAIKNIKLINENLKTRGIDILVLGEFENYILPITRILLPHNIKVLIMHHNNIDLMMQRKIQKIMFVICKNQFNHLVLDNFIGEELVISYKVNADKVYCWPHPMYETYPNQLKKYDCVGISHSNDEKVIQAIVNTEIQEHPIESNRLKVLLRSKIIEYDNGYLKVIKGWLSNEEYQSYLDNAKCVLVPFSKASFQFRPSGTVIDAFSRNTYVLGSDIALIRDYSKKFPSICKVFNVNSFVKDLVKMIDSKSNPADFEEFKLIHSNLKIQNLMKQSINNCC